MLLKTHENPKKRGSLLGIAQLNTPLANVNNVNAYWKGRPGIDVTLADIKAVLMHNVP